MAMFTIGVWGEVNVSKLGLGNKTVGTGAWKQGGDAGA